MNSSNFIGVTKLFSAQAIVKNTTALSGPIDISQCSGTMSLQIVLTGDGTLSVDALYSNDGIAFTKPESATALLSSITKTSGPGSDGKVFVSFSAKVAPWMKILLTETGNSQNIAVTATLAKF